MKTIFCPLLTLPQAAMIYPSMKAAIDTRYGVIVFKDLQEAKQFLAYGVEGGRLTREESEETAIHDLKMKTTL